MNTTPIQSLIQERDSSFNEEFSDSPNVEAFQGWPHYSSLADQIRAFNKASILAGIKLGLELGKEAAQLAMYKMEKQDSLWTPLQLRGWELCKRETLTALDEKVAEVEGMMV